VTGARGWTYRGHELVRRTPTPAILRVGEWARTTYGLVHPVEYMPSPQHDAQNPRSIHRDGRAADIYPRSDAQGWEIAHTLGLWPDPGGIQLVLWKDYQWGGRRGPGWSYTGRTDHNTHLHVETRLTS